MGIADGLVSIWIQLPAARLLVSAPRGGLEQKQPAEPGTFLVKVASVTAVGELTLGLLFLGEPVIECRVLLANSEQEDTQMRFCGGPSHRRCTWHLFSIWSSTKKCAGQTSAC